MSAFPDTHRRYIGQQIDATAERMALTIAPSPALGYADVMDMLSIKGELRNILLKGRSLINVSEIEANRISVPIVPGSVGLAIFVAGPNAPLMPREAVVSREFLETDERGRVLVKRATQLAEVADDWGLVDYVWAELNNRLASPAQVRYVWPSVLALMAGVDNEATQVLRSKLLPLKVPREIPNLPADFRALIRRAATVVSMSTMMAGLQGEVQSSTDVVLRLDTLCSKKPEGYYTKRMVTT